jgi:hypothetical protein
MPDLTVADIPDDAKSQACYAGVAHIFNFQKIHVMPILQTTFTLTKSERDKAIIGTYYRIHGWLETVTLLNRPSAFQGVGSAAKSLFELAVDLKLLLDDKSDKAAKQYFSFAVIDRHKSAQRALDFYARNNIEPEMYTRDSIQNAVLPDGAIKAILNQNWPGLALQAVNHWSAKNKFPGRLDGFGPEFERLYYEIYATMNWFDHAGPTCWTGKNFSAIHSGLQMAYLCVIRLMTLILTMMRPEFHFDKVVQSYALHLKELSMKPYEIMVQELEKMEKDSKGSIT